MQQAVALFLGEIQIVRLGPGAKAGMGQGDQRLRCATAGIGLLLQAFDRDRSRSLLYREWLQILAPARGDLRAATNALLNFHIGGRALGLFSVATRLKSRGDAAQYRVATDGRSSRLGRWGCRARDLLRLAASTAATTATTATRNERRSITRGNNFTFVKVQSGGHCATARGGG